MHDDIKRFTQEGFYRDDCDLIRIKDLWTRTIEDMMRVEGYIPNIDINVQWTQWYIEDKKCYGFKISMYGIYVGEESWEKVAASDGKIYPKL